MVLIERKTGRVFEAIVNLNTGKVEKWSQLPEGTQPTITPEELTSAENIFNADSSVRARCAKLGYNNMDNVAADPWYEQIFFLISLSVSQESRIKVK